MEGLYKKKKVRTGVNIVPLVDVLIVLIFFFLMTMQFRDQTMLDITPPEMETAEHQRLSDNVVIAVDKDGGIFYNEEATDIHALEGSLEKLATDKPSTPVLLLADQESALKYMTSVIDLSRKVGLKQLRLQVQ